MSDIAIKVENLSKQYRLGTVGTGTISHDLNRWWASIRGKEDPFLKIGETNDRSSKGNSDYVWSLKDINFEVKKGEVLGIIGKNGAGKSTLLKILSKVTGPTTGRIMANGRIGALLEVGTGFHPELTGRENIFLNGAILGMTKTEIRAKLDEIVDFSSCARYIDTPVKRYSSGMKVRLAFAVAAFLEPEILIVDEVLAVGDADFQKKAIGKMQDVSRGEGRTVLFVSHNMGSIQNLCSRCLLLENGVLRLDNSVDKVIGAYQSGLSNKMYSPVYQIDSIYGPLSVKLLNSEHRPTCNFRIGDQLVFKFNFSFPVTVERFNIGIGINNVQGNRIVTYHTSYEYGRNIKISPGLIVCCTINEFCLVVGSYYVEISLFHNSKDTFYNNKSVFCIDLIEADFFNTGKLPNKKQGLIVQKSKWQFNGV